VISNISAAVLGICKELAQRDTSIKCVPALDMILKIATELMSSPNPQVRRAMGEALGILCKIEGDAFMQRFVTRILYASLVIYFPLGLKASHPPHHMVGFTIVCTR
jgi:hypothetical protein